MCRSDSTARPCVVALGKVGRPNCFGDHDALVEVADTCPCGDLCDCCAGDFFDSWGGGVVVGVAVAEGIVGGDGHEDEEVFVSFGGCVAVGC